MNNRTATRIPQEYKALDEIEIEAYILLCPNLATSGRVIKQEIEGRKGIIYRDIKTGKFLSKEGLLKMVRG